MKWILIIAMYSPGNDWIGKYEKEMTSISECRAEVARLKDYQAPMGIRYKGICVQRDARGMNVGKEALD
jgi:hypothetical protein